MVTGPHYMCLWYTRVHTTEIFVFLYLVGQSLAVSNILNILSIIIGYFTRGNIVDDRPQRTFATPILGTLDSWPSQSAKDQAFPNSKLARIVDHPTDHSRVEPWLLELESSSVFGVNTPIQKENYTHRSTTHSWRCVLWHSEATITVLLIRSIQFLAYFKSFLKWTGYFQAHVTCSEAALKVTLSAFVCESADFLWRWQSLTSLTVYLFSLSCQAPLVI